MGYEDYSATQWGPCAMCGAPERGVMGSSKWGHEAMCCSDACGIAYRDSPQRAAVELERIEYELQFLRQQRRYWQRVAVSRP